MQDASEEEQLHATTAKLAEILDRRRGQYAQADIRIPLEDDDNNESGASLAEVASRSFSGPPLPVTPVSACQRKEESGVSESVVT